jgi:hypothetical protein
MVLDFQPKATTLRYGLTVIHHLQGSHPVITYTLPAYFGGIPPAPQDMVIIRSK